MRGPLSAALALVAIALALVACGGDEEQAGSSGGGGQSVAPAGQGGGSSDSGAASDGDRQTPTTAEQPTEAEREGEATVREFYEILGSESGGKRSADFDAAGFCELMSEQAREETQAFAKQATGAAEEPDCETAMRVLVLRAKQTGAFAQARRAKVIGVNAEGDRATASVRFGKGPVTTISLVREDGEWKLGSSVGGG